MTSSAPRSPMDRAFLTDLDDVTEIFLVRHGQQDYPDFKTATPDEWRDPPLTEQGHRQAAAAARHLAGERLDRVYSSDLSRAYDTGAAIATVHEVEHVVVPELEEIHMFRDLPAGQTAMDSVGPLLLAGYRERFARVRRWDVYPHTESSTDFRRRVNGAIEGVIDRHEGECVAIACHGGVINAYLTEILGLQEDMFFRPAHASVHRVFAHGDRRVIQTLNEVSHLLAPDDLLSY